VKHRINPAKIAQFVRLAAKIASDVVALFDGASPDEIAAVLADVEALAEAVKAARDAHPLEA